MATSDVMTHGNPPPAYHFDGWPSVSFYLKMEEDFTKLVNLAKDRLGWRSSLTLRHIERKILNRPALCWAALGALL